MIQGILLFADTSVLLGIVAAVLGWDVHGRCVTSFPGYLLNSLKVTCALIVPALIVIAVLG